MIKVIAEAGTCSGSVDWAHEAIDFVAETGAWGFKTQILSEEKLVAPNSPRYDRLKGPANQNEAFRNQIPKSAWGEVAAHCQEVGLEWFASVWEYEGIEVCEDIGVNYYKVGSADITHLPLLREIALTGKTIFVSTGAATFEEVDRAIEVVTNQGAPLILMACTLSYPCEPDDAYIGKLHWLASDPIWTNSVRGFGYSDHTRGIDTASLAVAAGATYLEKHFTITPGAGGDHDFALTPYRLADYVDAAQKAHRMIWPHNHDGQVLVVERAARELARRSLHATEDLKPGSPILIGVNAEWLRPTGGVEPNEEYSGPLISNRYISAGEVVKWEDILIGKKEGVDAELS